MHPVDKTALAFGLCACAEKIAFLKRAGAEALTDADGFADPEKLKALLGAMGSSALRGGATGALTTGLLGGAAGGVGGWGLGHLVNALRSGGTPEDEQRRSHLPGTLGLTGGVVGGGWGALVGGLGGAADGTIAATQRALGTDDPHEVAEILQHLKYRPGQ